MNKEETLALWTQGKDAWNAWAQRMLDQRAEMERDGTWAMDRNLRRPSNEATAAWIREATAEFEEQVFERNANLSGFSYPGYANFADTTFQQDAWFDGAAFGGYPRFDKATFNRTANFESVRFRGDAKFYKVRFSGAARFASATFGGAAEFDNVGFRGEAAFGRVTFSGDALFSESTFSGVALFESSRFSGDTIFHDATFGEDARFLQAGFDAYTSFAGATFAKLADFSATRGARAFTLEAAHFAEVPDFIQAHFEEAPRLDNVVIPEVRGVAQFLFPVLPGIDAVAGSSARYRALKRLAIQAHDHTRELDYSANELKALRGHPDSPLPCPLKLFRKDEEGKRLPWWPGGLRGTSRYWFGLGYEALSDFGRSMILPLLWWGLAAAGFAWGYVQHAISADRCAVGPGEPWSAALGLSIRKALPFAGIASSEKLNQIYACLYGIHAGSPTGPGALPERFVPVIPDAVDYLGMVQLVLSLLLLFLFLLAVRGHFRIR